MKPMPINFFEEQGMTVAMDVDDAEALEIFDDGGEGPLAGLDHHRLGFEFSISEPQLVINICFVVRIVEVGL
ncbi:hypothetical protein ACH5RR_031665 [Cinchona calisaya]|uniref:Uncharacterized protein n=1 Tax=Cinchona calisaya TaxID=153742 RepID=A0ABD2YL51_9GENT